MSGPYEVVDYAPRHREELIPLWRASFEAAVGVIAPHPLVERRWR